MTGPSAGATASSATARCSPVASSLTITVPAAIAITPSHLRSNRSNTKATSDATAMASAAASSTPVGLSFIGLPFQPQAGPRVAQRP